MPRKPRRSSRSRSFVVDVALADDYPDTPMARAMRSQYGSVAGTVHGVVRRLPSPFYASLCKSYGLGKGYVASLARRRKLWLHIAAFYMYPMQWELQRLAMPGELEASRGLGRRMLCRLVDEVLDAYQVSPRDLGVSLEAAGGECRFETPPSYDDWSDDDIRRYVAENFPGSVGPVEDDVVARPGGRSERQVLVEVLCVALDNAKLVDYYRGYGLAPVVGPGTTVNGTLMIGDAQGVLDRCIERRQHVVDAAAPLVMRSPKTPKKRRRVR